MDFSYNIKTINQMHFETTDISEFSESEGAFAARLSARDIANIPDETKDINKLRRRISELFHERFHDSYAKLEADCDIKRDTFQKILRFKNGRNVTYKLLAKFCVGMKLSTSEAKELFGYMGHHLDEQSRYDYILLCELNNRSDLSEYDEDLKKFDYPGIYSEPDNLSANED